MAERIDVHVGLPKTGTTSLQNMLFDNRSALGVAGVDLVVESMHQAFQAARDLVHGGDRAWSELADHVRRARGRVLLTCEGLSAVPLANVAAGVAALDCPDTRVIVTLRDPALVLPSVWQQLVRSGSTLTMADFLQTVRDGMRWEWLHEPAEVLDSWTAAVGAANVRLVVAPRSSEPSPDLWQRFSAACDLDPNVVPQDDQSLRTNSSLDASRIELLRQVNGAFGDRTPAEGQRFRELIQPLVKALSSTDATTPPALEPSDREWVAAMATEQVAGLRARGSPVYGDLAELLPEPVADTAAATEPDLELATRALAELLLALRAARRRATEAVQSAQPEPTRRRGGRAGRRGHRP